MALLPFSMKMNPMVWVHQVTTHLDKRKSDITHLVTKVDDLILKDEFWGKEREPWLSQEENGGVRQGKGLGSVSQPKEPPLGYGRGSWGVVRNILVERRGVEGVVGLERRRETTFGGRALGCSFILCALWGSLIFAILILAKLHFARLISMPSSTQFPKPIFIVKALRTIDGFSCLGIIIRQ